MTSVTKERVINYLDERRQKIQRVGFRIKGTLNTNRKRVPDPLRGGPDVKCDMFTDLSRSCRVGVRPEVMHL